MTPVVFLEQAPETIWSAKCLHPKASYRGKMVGMFCKKIINRKQQFSQCWKTSALPCSQSNGSCQWTIKIFVVLLCMRRSVASCSPWPVSTLSIYLLSYAEARSHPFIMSHYICCFSSLKIQDSGVL